MEILEAEQARRERGGSVGDLVADLPRILSAESGRSTIATTRGAPAADPPTIELHWPDHREQLVVDNTLAKLPGDRARRARRDARRRCTQFERELSDLRSADAPRDRRHRSRDRRPPGRRDRGMKIGVAGLARDAAARPRRFHPRPAPQRAAVAAQAERARGHLESVPQPDRARAAQAVGRDPPGDRARACASRPRRSTSAPASSTSGAIRPISSPRCSRDPIAHRAPEAGPARDLPVVPAGRPRGRRRLSDRDTTEVRALG